MVLVVENHRTFRRIRRFPSSSASFGREYLVCPARSSGGASRLRETCPTSLGRRSLLVALCACSQKIGGPLPGAPLIDTHGGEAIRLVREACIRARAVDAPNGTRWLFYELRRDLSDYELLLLANIIE